MMRTVNSAMASVLARKLGLSIVAEGVETEEDRQYLTKLGVDELQGFLFAKARPFEKLIDYIFNWSGEQSMGTDQQYANRRKAI